MTPEQAYDDCIQAAREGARRQLARKEYEKDAIMAQLHDTAAMTLSSFADMLEKMRAIRCQ